MASTKPNRTARWATDGGTTLEPLSGEKDTGWVVEEKPPARHMNFLQNMAFQWFRWFDERHDDGGTPADYVTHPEDPAAGAGGDAVYRGAHSVGTNLAGGDADLSGGEGTGTGSSKASLKASTAGSTGATPNVPEDYVVADGATGLVDFLKGLTNSSPLPTAVIPAALKSTGAEAVNAERNTTGSGGAGQTLVAKMKTSVEMVDGFGPAVAFRAEDATSGELDYGEFTAVRDGQDDNAELVFSPSEGGANPALRLRAIGLAQFLKGLTSDGFAGNANGVGILGRGLVSAGSLGTAITEVGAGFHGVGSEIGGGVTGYGGISQGAATTPSRASHLFVPMPVAPTAGEAGAVYPQEPTSTSHAKLMHHNGAEFERLVPQVFSSVSAEVLVGGVGAIWADVYVIPANTLRVGSVIRVFATGATVGIADGGNVDYTVRLNDGTPLAAVGTSTIAIASSGQWVIEGRWTVKTIGVSGEVLLGGVGSHGPEATPEVKSQSGTSGTTLSTTVAVTIEAVVVFSVATSGNTARMDQFIVEVT